MNSKLLNLLWFCVGGDGSKYKVPRSRIVAYKNHVNDVISNNFSKKSRNLYYEIKSAITEKVNVMTNK